jgi:hypothetical protein
MIIAWMRRQLHGRVARHEVAAPTGERALDPNDQQVRMFDADWTLKHAMVVEAPSSEPEAAQLDQICTAPGS